MICQKQYTLKTNFNRKDAKSQSKLKEIEGN